MNSIVTFSQIKKINVHFFIKSIWCYSNVQINKQQKKRLRFKIDSYSLLKMFILFWGLKWKLFNDISKSIFSLMMASTTTTSIQNDKISTRFRVSRIIFSLDLNFIFMSRYCCCCCCQFLSSPSRMIFEKRIYVCLHI